MKKYVITICLLIFSVILVKCGDKFSREEVGTTSITINTPTHQNLESKELKELYDDNGNRIASVAERGDVLETVPPGGMIVYALNTANGGYMGRKFIPAGSSTTTWSNIPNGTYSFYLVGFNDTNISDGNMSGAPICGIAANNPITLTGAALEVNFSPSTGACNSPPFNSAAITSFKVQFCNSTTNISGLTDVNQSCSSVSGNFSTTYLAAKMVVYEQDEFNGPLSTPATATSGSSALDSGCISLANGLSASFPKMPSGDIDGTASTYYKNYHLKAELIGYPTSLCTGTGTSYTFDLGFYAAKAASSSNSGFGSGPPYTMKIGGATAANGKSIFITSGGTAKLYIKE